MKISRPTAQSTRSMMPKPKPNRLNSPPTRLQTIRAIRPPMSLGPQPVRSRLVTLPYTAITPK